MSFPYVFIAVFSDDTETRIESKPDEFIVTGTATDTTVRAEWCRKAFGRDATPAGWPFHYVWPNVDRVRVLRPVDNAVMADVSVTEVGFDNGKFFFVGTSDGSAPPLVLDVESVPDDPTGMTVLVRIDNHNRPTVVDVGDGSPETTVPGDPTAPLTHTYAAPGEYTITVTDNADPDNADAVTIAVPWVEP